MKKNYLLFLIRIEELKEKGCEIKHEKPGSEWKREEIVEDYEPGYRDCCYCRYLSTLPSPFYLLLHLPPTEVGDHKLDIKRIYL